MKKLMGIVFALIFLSVGNVSPSHAAEAGAILLNGSDGAYWGLSKAEIKTKAPGKFASEEKLLGFVILFYADSLGKTPVEIRYSLKDDKCWKITVTAKTDNRRSLEKLFEETVANLAKTIGPASKREVVPDISLSAVWDGDETGARVYCMLADDKNELAISYESTALTEAVWGKLAG